MQNEIRINVERRIHRAFQRIQADQGIIEISAGIEVRAERFQFFANLQRIARRRAFLQHALRKAGRTRRICGIGRVPAVDHQREVHHRSGMPLRQHDLQTVAERGSLLKEEA